MTGMFPFIVSEMSPYYDRWDVSLLFSAYPINIEMVVNEQIG